MEKNNQLSENEREQLESFRIFAKWVAFRHKQVLLEWLDESSGIIELHNQMLDENGTDFHKWLKMNDELQDQIRLQNA